MSNKKEKIIVSLTSYPDRIGIVNQAIETLLNQTYKADKVVLWLAKEQFPNREEELPEELLRLKNRGLEIEWCNDIKSYKKLIPALKKYPNDVIVTADDDLLYDKHWLEALVNAYKKHPNFLNVHRCHYISFVKPLYKICYDYFSNVKPCYNLFCTTGGGILYPPHLFTEEVFKENIFMKLAPTSDDIWFWAMTVLQGIKIRVVKNNIQDLEYIEGTQEECLWKFNEREADKQLNDILNKYPQITKRLEKKILFSNKYNLGEQIFSIKNMYCGETKLKILTIFGLKLKFYCRQQKINSAYKKNM